MSKLQIISLLCVASCLGLWSCSKDEPRTVIQDGDTDAPADSDPNEGIVPPAPYTDLTFTIEEVEVQTSAAAAGYQGKLLRGSDGTLYYGYFRDHGTLENSCDIAAFGGDAAPGINYEVHVAVKGPAATTWTVEDLPLADIDPAVPFVTSRYGLDGTMNASDQPVFVFAGGSSGLFSCGSGDLVVATRTGANAYTFSRPVTNSAACCATPDPCIDAACTSGTDVGPWAAVTLDDANQLAVMYLDYHNNVDEDGISSRGLELWRQSGNAVTGIRPWSGLGQYGQLRNTAAHSGATFTGLVAAYTSSTQEGVYVARKVGSAGLLADWSQQNLRSGWQIGERLSMAIAADGTLGLAFRAIKNNLGQTVDDLVYCYSGDNGVTWSNPCETVDSAGSVGHTPSLAFDKNSRPMVSYYFCGTSGDCATTSDGLRFAWRDDAVAGNQNPWKRWNVRFQGNRRDGLYSSLVVDPTTDEPAIVFQDITTGAAMFAQGTLTGGL